MRNRHAMGILSIGGLLVLAAATAGASPTVATAPAHGPPAGALAPHPATLECTGAESTRVASEPAARPRLRVPPACAAEIEPPSHRGLPPAYLLVDVRPRAAAQSLRIPGALHIPAYALASKAFLRDRRVVLIGAGPEALRLPALCAELRARGFRQVTVARGGLAGWIEAGGPVSGRNRPAWTQRLIEPRHLHAHLDERPWTLVDASLRGLDRRLLPPAVTIVRAAGEPPAWRAVLQAEAAGRAGRLALVLDDAGTGYAAMHRSVPEDLRERVLYLRGGLPALEAFAERQALAAASRVAKGDEGCPG